MMCPHFYFLTGGSVKVVSRMRALALAAISGACAFGGHASAAMVGPGDVLGPDPSANVDRSLPVGTVVAHETRDFTAVYDDPGHETIGIPSAAISFESWVIRAGSGNLSFVYDFE